MTRTRELSPDMKYLSGQAYVSVTAEWDADRIRVKTAVPHHCEHGVTICATWSCVESWATDYNVHLGRTAAGREIIEALGLDPNLAYTIKCLDTQESLAVRPIEQFQTV